MSEPPRWKRNSNPRRVINRQTTHRVIPIEQKNITWLGVISNGEGSYPHSRLRR